MIRRRFPYRKFAWTVGLILCLPLVLHAILPLLVNSQWVRNRIIAEASKAFSGQFNYQKMEAALLPRPHVELSRALVVRGEQLRVEAAKASVYLRFWPLLRGRFALAQLRVIQPEIHIQAPLDMHMLERKPQPQSSQAFPDEMRALLNHLTGRGESVSVGLEKALVELSGAGPEDGRRLQFEDMDLTLEMVSPQKGEFKAGIQVDAPVIRIQSGADPVTLNDLVLMAGLRWTPQQTRVVFERLSSAAPQLQLEGSGTWTAGEHPSGAAPILLTLNGSGLDLGEIRTAGIKLAGDATWVNNIFRIVRGGKVSAFNATAGFNEDNRTGFADSFQMTCRLTDGEIAVPDDLLSLHGVNGDVRIAHGKLSADHLTARTGNTRAQNGKLALSLWDKSRAFTLDIDLDADLSELPPVLRKLAKSGEPAAWLDGFPEVRGRATGRLSLGDRLNDLKVDISSTRARVAILDAALEVEGSVKGLSAADTSAALRIKGDLGASAVQWLGQTFHIPDRWRPFHPITVKEANLTRQPHGKWGLSGDFFQNDDVELHAALDADSNEIDLKQLHVKDPSSDALIVYQRKWDQPQWDASFSGIFSSVTADKIWRENEILHGRLEGDLQVHMDMDAPLRSSIQGDLEIHQADLAMGDLGTMRVRDASLKGRHNGITISSADLTWKEYDAQIAGDAIFGPAGLNLDLQVDTDTLNIDKLILAYSENRPEAQSGPLNGLRTPEVRGKIDVQARHALFSGYRFASLQAIVSMEDDHTTVDISQSYLCDVAVKGRLQISHDGLQMVFEPHAAQSKLKDTEACLGRASITERLEGVVSADGRITTTGRTARELTNNLSGNLDFSISDGRVYNVGAAGFFTNLLSFLSVNQLIQGGLPDLRRNDFRYKSLESKLTLKDGLLHIREGVLKSNSVNIVASGEYKLSSTDLDLVLLVSPLTTVDWIVERIPIVGNILQGTLVAIPVGVKGPIADPNVVPLSPTAVGSRLGGILERTIKTPFRILSPLLEKDSP